VTVIQRLGKLRSRKKKEGITKRDAGISQRGGSSGFEHNRGKPSEMELTAGKKEYKYVLLNLRAKSDLGGRKFSTRGRGAAINAGKDRKQILPPRHRGVFMARLKEKQSLSVSKRVTELGRMGGLE